MADGGMRRGVAVSMGRVSPGALVFAVGALISVWVALDDVGFRDSGELGAAAQLLGVAHPTGFGLDLLLLRAAALLPLGHVAFRQNLIVALEAAAALGLLASLCDQLSRRLGVEGRTERMAGALLAVAGLATWHTFIATAIAVEVYSLALMFVLLAANAAVRGRRTAGACCVILGLAPGLHVTAGLVTLVIVAGVLGLGRRSLRFLTARVPVVLAGALIIAYLPLASGRNPPLDWGDPESLVRVFEHLTALRIRNAFRDEMLHTNTNATLALLSQLGELWPLLPMVAMGIVLGSRRKLGVLLGPLALLAVDLGYSMWINPMGVVDRQVGHLAGASLTLVAGLGAAMGCSEFAKFAGRMPQVRHAASGIIAGLAACVLLRAPRAPLRDGTAASELLGSAGPLAALPSRSVLVCWTDDACAAGLFARYVDVVRPDIDVVPAQHLWDPTVRRRLAGLPQLASFGLSESSSERRADLGRAVLRVLSMPDSPRPLWLESAAPLARIGFTGQLESGLHAPFLRPRLLQTKLVTDIDQALARLAAMRAERFSRSGPSAEYAREAWSRSYASVGETALGTRAAVRAMRSAALLTPERAAAWTNLGVALERTGDASAAIACLHRAIELEPARSTAWVNLVRLELERRDSASARRALAAALAAGIRDPRLDQLADAVIH